MKLRSKNNDFSYLRLLQSMTTTAWAMVMHILTDMRGFVGLYIRAIDDSKVG